MSTLVSGTTGSNPLVKLAHADDDDGVHRRRAVVPQWRPTPPATKPYHSLSYRDDDNDDGVSRRGRSKPSRHKNDDD
jgi:hypothetical protein